VNERSHANFSLPHADSRGYRSAWLFTVFSLPFSLSFHIIYRSSANLIPFPFNITIASSSLYQKVPWAGKEFIFNIGFHLSSSYLPSLSLMVWNIKDNIESHRPLEAER